MIDWDEIRYFKRHEFKYHDDIEPDERLVLLLDEARLFAGIPFTINSGIRSPAHNASVGGSPDSAHLTGHAVDIRAVTSRHRFNIVDGLMAAGATRIGINPWRGFIHVDTDPSKPQNVIWIYDQQPDENQP
jgi:uncharacterized protein YcbK (DUF882 family)